MPEYQPLECFTGRVSDGSVAYVVDHCFPDVEQTASAVGLTKVATPVGVMVTTHRKNSSYIPEVASVSRRPVVHV